MSGIIIDGKEVASKVRESLKDRILNLKNKGITPGLAVILVGEDPASKSYVKAKERTCKELGMYSSDNKLPENIKQDELLALVKKCNNDPKIHGILVQLPLPKHIDEQLIIESISPNKDVDGFHPVSVGKMVLGQDTFVSCTPNGILKLMEYSKIETSGKHVVIVGRSNIVGKPMSNLLIQKSPTGNATVTVCHSRTKDLKNHTLQADILIAAVGVPEIIKKDMVKDNCVVIDVGVNRVEDSSKKRGYRLVGDVEFETVKDKASFITPVPGGVGPMTITMLMFNTVESAERELSKEK